MQILKTTSLQNLKTSAFMDSIFLHGVHKYTLIKHLFFQTRYKLQHSHFSNPVKINIKKRSKDSSITQ